MSPRAIRSRLRDRFIWTGLVLATPLLGSGTHCNNRKTHQQNTPMAKQLLAEQERLQSEKHRQLREEHKLQDEVQRLQSQRKQQLEAERQSRDVAEIIRAHGCRTLKLTAQFLFLVQLIDESGLADFVDKSEVPVILLVRKEYYYPQGCTAATIHVATRGRVNKTAN
jgi:hypothetical protein